MNVFLTWVAFILGAGVTIALIIIVVYLTIAVTILLWAKVLEWGNDIRWHINRRRNK